MKKLLLIALVSLGMQGMAQDYFFTLTWDHSLPVGQTADKISNYSVRGIGMDSRWVFDEKYSFGFYMGWHTMYERKDNYSAEINNSTLYGTQFRYINSIPIQLNAHYYFNPRSKVSFYAGVGAGITWLEYRTELNLWALVDEGWRFGYYPEVGAHIPLNRTTKIMVAAKYQNALGLKGGDSYSYMSFDIGLSWGFF